MYLQGDLQVIFDALYHMGVIDPVLEMDWGQAAEELPEHIDSFSKVVDLVNSFQGDAQSLMGYLEQFDEAALGYLAMEVAREFVDFHSRSTIH